jgi:hypothetical protein
MSFSLAEELRQHDVAVNVLFPGATRTEGPTRSPRHAGRWGIQALRLLRPDHVVPVALHFAGQRPDDDGDTGLAIDSPQRNASHGHGDVRRSRAS